MKTIALGGTSRTVVDYSSQLGQGFESLPYSLRVLAENAARQAAGDDHVQKVAARSGQAVAFRPSRLLLQDMLGLPILVDLMAMRSALVRSGVAPSEIDMGLPVDLVIDHSMSVEFWSQPDALERNTAREFEINAERFAFIKACESRFNNLRVIPPGGGIMHQVNLEYLGTVVGTSADDPSLLIPDTCLGSDSHTPMINALGVLGWGIGGLEAESIMLGEPSMVNVPRVIGLEVKGSLSTQATATDIALTVAESLRRIGVVDCFVELFGEGYSKLSVADRATIANMAPEYGATSVFCPVDDNTLDYLIHTGRAPEHVKQVELYCRQQGLFAATPTSAITYDEVVTLDLSSVRKSVAGPSRPEQRMDLEAAKEIISTEADERDDRRFDVEGAGHSIGDGDVIIAAISSCTNTANPRNIVLAGLLARNALARGLSVPPHVKTSLTPGSRVVGSYLASSGLDDAFRQLGFEIASFSCATCNGMSGPLRAEHEQAIREHDIDTVAVLSGNRNFQGRIHPLSKRNVLASPPLVVAYALAGNINRDIASAPLGFDTSGNPVLLEELWPEEHEVDEILETHLDAAKFESVYANIATVNPHWNSLEVNDDDYEWVPSTYVTFPPYIERLTRSVVSDVSLSGLRPLVILGDSVTTDHITPSGAIVQESDAGKYLSTRGVAGRDFNSFGTRRGSSDIVIRSTFANVRLQNEMTPDRVGPWTRVEPEGDVMSVFEAIETYQQRNEPLIIIGGREYGCGSSRDTAAKGPWLAGVRVVLAESFERIHRSNLVNMGIIPVTFPEGVNRVTLGLDGTETYDLSLTEDMTAGRLTVRRADGRTETIDVDAQLYNETERATYRAGGLLPKAFSAVKTRVEGGSSQPVQ